MRVQAFYGAPLTKRERQVVEAARRGVTNKVVAYELGITASTVGVHLYNAHMKTGSRTRKQLFARVRPQRRAHR